MPSISLRKNDFYKKINLTSEQQFIKKVGTLPSPKPLWASLKDIADKQESHQRTILIVLKIYFVKLINKSGAQNPLK